MTLAAKASAAEWLATARAAAHQPPAQARQPLWAAGQAVGSVATKVPSDGCNAYPLAAQFVDLVSFFSGQVCVVQSAFLCDWPVNKRASYALLAQLIAWCTSFWNPPLKIPVATDPTACPATHRG